MREIPKGNSEVRFRKQNGIHWASQVVLVVENLPAKAGDTRDVGLIPGLGRSLGGGKWQSTAVFLPGKFHGQEEPGGL